MSFFDLVKATIVCGLLAFLCYSFPVLGQVLLIAFLSLVWLAYAHKTISTARRKRLPTFSGIPRLS